MANWKVYVTKFSGADGAVIWTRKLLDEECAAAVVPGWRSGLFVEGGVIYADIAANPNTLTTGVYLWWHDPGDDTTMHVNRYSTAGAADASGTLGAATVWAPADWAGVGGCCGLPDGSLLAGGMAGEFPGGGQGLVFVARFTGAGALDPTFGASGLALASSDPAAFAGWGAVPSSVSVRPDGSGKITVSLFFEFGPPTDDVPNFLTFSSSGTLLSSATVPASYSPTVFILASAVLSDGRIVTLTQDTTSGTHYYLVLYSGATEVNRLEIPSTSAISGLCGLPGGDFLVATFDVTSTSALTLAVTKYAAADLSVTWATTGAVPNNAALSAAQVGVAVGTDGKVTAAAAEFGAGHVTLMRLLASGAKDTTFGTGGVVSFVDAGVINAPPFTFSRQQVGLALA